MSKHFNGGQTGQYFGNGIGNPKERVRLRRPPVTPRSVEPGSVFDHQWAVWLASAIGGPIILWVAISMIGGVSLEFID